MIRATLSRYIAGHTLRAIALAFLIVTAIITLVDYVESSRNIGAEADLSPLQLLGLTFLRVPKLIEQTIPFVVLFGVMGAFATMNRRSELTVMRAAGLSAWWFLRPALMVTACLGIAWSTLLNPLASSMSGEYDSLSAELLGKAPAENIWLREGTEEVQRVIKAKKLDLSQMRLEDVVFYEMSISRDDNSKFNRRYDAKTATLQTPNYWTLSEVTENGLNVPTRHIETITVPTQITLTDLRKQSGQKTAPPFWSIGEEIKATEKAGFSARSLRLQLHKLFALPFLLIAMTFIAASVSMSLVRGGGTLRLLITGSVVGFAVFFADSIFTAFGEVAVLPVILAAWIVPLMALMLGINHLANIEDG